MSVKRFCDNCGTEMMPQPGDSNEYTPMGRLTATVHSPTGTKLQVEVIVSSAKDLNSPLCSNRGDICKYCVLDALQRLDDRPKPLEATWRSTP